MIEESWRAVSLGEVVTLQRGFDLPARLRAIGDVPVVSSSGVSGSHNKPMVSGPGVVTGRYGTIGDVFFIDGSFWPLNTTLWVSDFHGNEPRYIYYLLQRIDFATHSGKSGVPGVNRNDLHKLNVSLPRSINEQRRIAESLTDADELISSLERLIAKKQAIKQGMMQRLFSGSVGVAVSDPATRSGRLVGFLRQPATYGIVKAGEFQRAGVPMVRGGDIRDGTLSLDLPRVTRKKSDEYARTVLQQGDVVIALVGYPGESAVVPSALIGANISRAVGLLRPTQDLLPEFLAHYLNSPLGRREFLKPSAGSAQIVVNLVDLNRMEIRIPSTNVQSAIAITLNDADTEIATLRAFLNKTVAVRTGMMQELLTGHTRLPLKETVS
jgi:type I restriction enzyme S subunit